MQSLELPTWLGIAAAQYGRRQWLQFVMSVSVRRNATRARPLAVGG